MQGTDLNYVQQVFSRGGVIAYPTEAVWGLGCDPFNEKAVKKILSLKQRNINKGLILIAANIKQFSNLLSDLSTQEYHTLNTSWPGHTTWVVPNNSTIPIWIRGQHSSVALRVSKHPIVAKLSNRLGVLVSTSANTKGYKPAVSVQEVESYFGDKLDYIYTGQTSNEINPSQIIDLIHGNKLR